MRRSAANEDSARSTGPYVSRWQNVSGEPKGLLGHFINPTSPKLFAVSSTISGLLSGTQIHYRVVVTTDFQTFLGVDRTFTTT